MDSQPIYRKFYHILQVVYDFTAVAIVFIEKKNHTHFYLIGPFQSFDLLPIYTTVGAKKDMNIIFHHMFVLSP